MDCNGGENHINLEILGNPDLDVSTLVEELKDATFKFIQTRLEERLIELNLNQYTIWKEGFTVFSA